MIPLIIQDDFLKKEQFEFLKENFKHKFMVENILLTAAIYKLYKHRLTLKKLVDNPRCEHSDIPQSCFWNIHLVTLVPGREKGKHRDAEWKLLSSILYVSDEGGGTIFIDEEGEHQIEWKPNRLVSFIPSEDSWHRYENMLNTERRTVNFNYGNKISVEKNEEQR